MPRTSNINRPVIHARARPNTSHTSPRAIKLQQRRAAALDYRLHGHPFWKIGKALNVNASTAHDYIVRAMKDMLPVEKREAVLQQELARLDLMQAAVYRDAEHGDIPAQEAVLKIMHARARYLGLYPDSSRGGGVHVNIGGDPSKPNAEDTGIQVTFVRATKWGRDDAERTVNSKLLDLPVLDHSGFNGGGKPRR